MAKPYAPDKDHPYPKPKTGGNNGGGGRNRGGQPNMPDVLGPGGVKNLAIDMAQEFPGGVKAWKKDINEPYHYRFKWGGTGGGNGGNGGNNGDPALPVDPSNPGPVRPDVAYPGHSRAAMPGQMATARGFLPAGASTAQAPTAGMFAAQAQARPAAQQQMKPQQPQLPPEVLAWMRAQQMGR